MNANHKVLIFTDLDGSLLDRDTFKFDKISKYIKNLISKGIFIIPNSSKTKNENRWNSQTSLRLPCALACFSLVSDGPMVRDLYN